MSNEEPTSQQNIVDETVINNKNVTYKIPIRRHKRNGTIISQGGSGAPQATANRERISDAMLLMHRIIDSSVEIDRNGLLDTFNAMDMGVLQEYTQNQLALMKIMNDIIIREEKVLLYDKTYLSDLEFSHFILNSFYMKFFTEFIASPKCKVVYRGIRSSFRIYDIPLYRMRLFVINKAVVAATPNSKNNNIMSGNKGNGGIIEIEKRFRQQLMLMSRAKQLPPVVFSSLVPVFKNTGILDHMQYVVEHDEYKQLMNIRKDTALASVEMGNDWDVVLDPINYRGGSLAKPGILKNSQPSLQQPFPNKAPRIGSLGRDVGVGFAYAMIIPHRMSTTLRSALLLRNDVIDRSLGPEIRTFLHNMVSQGFTTFDFTLDDILIELSSSGALQRIRLGFLHFNQPVVKINQKSMTPAVKNSLNESIVLFSMSFYCAILIEIFRLNIASDIIASQALGTSGFVPSNPLVAFMHVDCDGNVNEAIKMIQTVCQQSPNFIRLHIRRVLTIWQQTRIRTAHHTSMVDHLFPVDDNYNAGSLGDIITIILSQYENVTFRS